MAKCIKCGIEIPDERLECYQTCISCTDQSIYRGYSVYPHKTGGEAILIKTNNKEMIRQADRANKRAR